MIVRSTFQKGSNNNNDQNKMKTKMDQERIIFIEEMRSEQIGLIKYSKLVAIGFQMMMMVVQGVMILSLIKAKKSISFRIQMKKSF